MKRIIGYAFLISILAIELLSLYRVILSRSSSIKIDLKILAKQVEVVSECGPNYRMTFRVDGY
jgi:hypothetical protein